MTQRCIIAAAWDFADYGSVTYTLTDSAGAHAPFSFVADSKRYEHRALCADAGVASPALTNFSSAFQDELNAASPTRTYAVTWSDTTGLYTITVNSGTFSIALGGTGDSGALLGCTTIVSTGTTWTSQYVPWFVIVPRFPGVTNYIWPQRVDGMVKERVTSSGMVKRLRPTSIGRECSWEHHFEPKYMVDRDAYGATADVVTHLYTWEDLWDDYGLGKLPIGMLLEGSDGNVERIAFTLSDAAYSRAVAKRRTAADDVRFTVMVKARLWRAAAVDSFARTFNA